MYLLLDTVTVIVPIHGLAAAIDNRKQSISMISCNYTTNLQNIYVPHKNENIFITALGLYYVVPGFHSSEFISVRCGV